MYGSFVVDSYDEEFGESFEGPDIRPRRFLTGMPAQT